MGSDNAHISCTYNSKYHALQKILHNSKNNRKYSYILILQSISIKISSYWQTDCGRENLSRLSQCRCYKCRLGQDNITETIIDIIHQRIGNILSRNANKYLKISSVSLLCRYFFLQYFYTSVK